MRSRGVQRAPVALAAAAVSFSLLAARAQAQLPSFAGAQGFGGNATGGRGGSIYVVTNLNDAGTGSFRDAVSVSNRIVVFGVSGYVNLQSAVSAKSNLTILGQTAPGQGFGLMGREVSFSDQSNDIVQYMKFREGSVDPDEKNSLALGNTTNVIVDHCSIEYGQYNNIDATGTKGSANLTMQNCIIADPIKAQQFNMHTEGTQTTYLNNLWANAHNRNPLAKSNSQYVDNVIYDYQGGYTTGNSSGKFTYDVVNNYFIAGPATSTTSNDFYQVDSSQSAYLSGNYLDGNADGQLNGSVDSTADAATPLAGPWSAQTQFLPTLTAAGAYAFTLAHSGALYANASSGAFDHDAVDAQTVAQVRSLGTAGSIYNSESTGGGVGFGTLSVANNSSGSLATVPYAWLIRHGLSTTSTADLLKLNPLGYRFLEQYAQEVQDQYARQTATTGSWTTTKWTTAVPTIYDRALIRGTGTGNGTVTVSGTEAASAFSVSIGGNGLAAGEMLAVSGGSLVVQDTVTVGDSNNGILALSGGTVRANNVQLGNTVYDASGNAASYTGTFNLTGGTLQVGQVVSGAGTPGSYKSGGVWNWNGGTLQANGTLSVNVPATLTGAGATINTTGPDGVANNGTVSAVLSGTGGFAKTGNGVLTFAVANTYTGPTAISGGGLLVAVDNAVNPASPITVTGGGLQLGNGVTVTQRLTIAGSTTTQFIDAPGTGNATYAGTVAQTGSSQYRVGDSGTGTITFTGATNVGTKFAFVTQGNIAFAKGGTLTETATDGGLTVGRDPDTAANLTVTGTGSAVNVTRLPAGFSGLTLGSGNTANENPTVTVTVAGGGSINVGPSTVDLDNDVLPAATTTVATLNLNAGGTLTAGAIVATAAGAGTNLAALKFAGGTLVAGGNDPSGGAFLPNLTGVSVTVGNGGAAVNSNGYAVTIAEPLLTAGGADGGLTKSGPGTLTLTGGNTYTGPTAVSGGTLLLTTVSTKSSGATVATGATLLLGAAGGANNVLGVGTAALPVAVTGGTLSTSDGTTHNLNAVTLTGGTLAGAASPASGYGDYTFNGGVTVNGATDSAVTAAGRVGLKPAIPFTVGTDGGRLLVSAVLANEPGNTGGVTKLGGGTMVLSAANTYTGPTAVSAGTLRVTNGAGSGTGTGAVTVASGATLGGTGIITGAVAVGGTIAAGATDTDVGTLTTGPQTWATGGILAAQLNSSGGSASVVAGNDVVVMSSLDVSSLTSFAVNVTALGIGTPTVPSEGAGRVLVLANDKDTSTTGNPFASSAVLSKLTLTVTGVASATGSFTLATQRDTLGNGGYDLVLMDAVAAPEPNSFLLAAAAAVPLALGRRRPRPPG